MWSGAVSFDGIRYRAFDDNALSVTTEQTNFWTIFTVAAIPVCIVAAGVVIYIRRRHS